MENQSRVQKIEEAREHLKYKENILEFEQTRVDMTDPDAEAPPRYCKKFELEKVQALVARYTKVSGGHLHCWYPNLTRSRENGDWWWITESSTS